ERLRREEDPPAVHPVRHRPPDQHEGDEGQLRGERAQAEVERVAEPRVDEPGEGDVLGPGADAREESADPEEAEAPEGEGGEETGEPRGLAAHDRGRRLNAVPTPRSRAGSAGRWRRSGAGTPWHSLRG